MGIAQGRVLAWHTQGPEFKKCDGDHTRNGHQILRIREAGLHVPTFQVRKEHKGKNGAQFLVKGKSTPNGSGAPWGGETSC